MLVFMVGVFAFVVLPLCWRGEHAFGFRVGLFFFEIFFLFGFRFRGGLLGRRKARIVGRFVRGKAAILRGACSLVNLRVGDVFGNDGRFLFG